MVYKEWVLLSGASNLPSASALPTRLIRDPTIKTCQNPCGAEVTATF